MRKATKIIISFAVVLIAGLNFIVPAFAQDPFTAIAIGGFTGASGAGLFSSMAAASGINIGYTNTDPVDAMWNVLNPDHVYFSGTKHEATGVGEDIYDYIEVDIGDWLQAQRDFIDEFVTNYNVTDNDSGTITNSADYLYHGYPITYSWTTASAIGVLAPNSTIALGNAVFTVGAQSPYGGYPIQAFYQGQLVASGSIGNSSIGKGLCIYNDGSTPLRWCVMMFYGEDFATGIPASEVYGGNKTVNWTSGIVDTTKFDDWTSGKVKIDHTAWGLSAGWTVQDFLNKLNEIWSNGQQQLITIENGGDVPPVPPTPIPTTPLGEVPFDDWIDLWGQGIYEQLENQSDTLDFIGSNGEDAIEELESIDTNLQDIAETAESIDTNIGVGNGILGGIRSLAQSAVNNLEGIAEHVGELVEEIVEGTETLIAGILNQIPQAFGVIFGPIKQASSIWHYVVEWITSIGAPFQFIWSMASGTSYYVILPVYASLAAAVVLAFFKRFGR